MRVRGNCGYALLALLLLSFFGNPVSAAVTSAVVPTRPRAIFLPAAQSPPIVLGGGVAHCSIKVQNSGTGLLEILDVVPGCGCTTASFDRLIPPGAVGVVRADIQTEATWKFTTREISIFTNDPLAAPEVVRLGIEVTPIITVDPGDVVSDVSHNGSPIRRRFNLHAEDRALEDVKLQMTTAGPISARLTSGPDGLTWTVDAIITPPADGSDMRGQIHLDSPTKHFRPINLVWVVQGDGLSHSPSEIFFGKTREGAGTLDRSLVVSSQDMWFHVIRVSGDAHLSARWERVGSGICMWKLLITYNGGWSAGVHEGTLKVVTDAPRWGTTTVPYHIEVVR